MTAGRVDDSQKIDPIDWLDGQQKYLEKLKSEYKNGKVVKTCYEAAKKAIHNDIVKLFVAYDRYIESQGGNEALRAKIKKVIDISKDDSDSYFSKPNKEIFLDIAKFLGGGFAVYLTWGYVFPVAGELLKAGSIKLAGFIPTGFFLSKSGFNNALSYDKTQKLTTSVLPVKLDADPSEISKSLTARLKQFEERDTRISSLLMKGKSKKDSISSALGINCDIKPNQTSFYGSIPPGLEHIIHPPHLHIPEPKSQYPLPPNTVAYKGGHNFNGNDGGCIPLPGGKAPPPPEVELPFPESGIKFV